MPGQDFGVKRQTEIYLSGVRGRKPRVPIDSTELENRAKLLMSPEGFAYVAGGAGTESTMRANRAAFERWRIVPRMLRDVAVRDTSIELFGQTLPAPILLAPIGVLEMAHHDAEFAVGQAAAKLGVPVIFSNQASQAIEACARVMGDAPRWFQLYWSKSDELVKSFVRRAENNGCHAIVVTLDTTMLGWRTRDLDYAYLPFLRGKGIAQYVNDPVFLSSLDQLPASSTASSGPINLSAIQVLIEMTRSFPGSFWKNIRSRQPRAAVQQFIATYSRPSLTWDNLAFLRQHTKLPILLKGILHPDDGRQAIQYGVDGVIVSNHGGRQVDGAIGALDALPGVVEAIGGKIPVLFDSGIRCGADVFKALALGARAVCIGRPYVYGLAIAGREGVREVIQNLLAEFDLTLGLAGCRSVAEISRESVMAV